MAKYVLGRLVLLIPTLLGMSMLIFLMLRLLPGDIVDIIAGADAQADTAAREQLREAMGLADPLPVQYCPLAGEPAAGRSRHVVALGSARRRAHAGQSADHGRAGRAGNPHRHHRRHSARRHLGGQAGHRPRFCRPRRRADRAVAAELLDRDAGPPLHLENVRLGAEDALHLAASTIRSAICSR